MFASALALGLSISLPLGLLSAVLTLRASARRDGRLVLVATGMLVLLLIPGIALQCVDAAAGSFFGWLLGTLLGAGIGIAAGLVPWRTATPLEARETRR